MKPVRYTDAMVKRYEKLGFWTDETMVGVWEKNADAFPGKVAISDAGRQLTWSKAAEEIDRAAKAAVALGIGRDEVVVGQLSNTVGSVTLRLALEKAGVLYLAGSVAWREAEVEHIIGSLNAVAVVVQARCDDFDYAAMYRDIRGKLPSLKHVILWDDRLPAEENLRRAAEGNTSARIPRAGLKGRIFSVSETSCINASSGTTGLPKLVETATAPTILFGKVVARGLQMGAEDIVAAIGSIHWGPGIGAVYSGAPLKGARIVLLEKFDPELALDFMEREKVTVAAGSTAQLVAIVRSPRFERKRLAALRCFYWAGAPLPYSVAREVEEKTDCVLVGAYGAMDAGYFASSSVDDSPEVRNLMVGKALDGNEAIIVDDQSRRLAPGAIGEIWFRGACCFAGPFKDEAAAIRAWGRRGAFGWYHTGDMGKMDSAGNIAVLGRMKDVIQVEGNPVYPSEIENALVAHPELSNAAVVPVRRETGASFVAFVIPRKGKSFSYPDMAAYLKSRGLPEYKIPSRLEIRSKFPLSGDGVKISRKDLEAEAASLPL